MTDNLRILDLLWGAGDPAGADWAEIDRIGARHRIRPLLHRRADETHWPLPDDISAYWTGSYRRSSLRALRQYAIVARIGEALAQAGIEAILLKGGSLVWRGWTDPALRPMRDIDILVAEADALRADVLLRGLGFDGPAADGIGREKHLPGLTHGVTRVHVELHTRIADGFGRRSIAREAALRATLVQGAQPLMPGFGVFAPAGALLHLILHGVLDHQFNNGPLLLLDIRLLVENAGIDWAEFWRLGERAGAIRACQLALGIAERHGGGAGIDWQGHLIPDAVTIDAAAALMLVEKGGGWAGRLIASADRDRLARIGAMIARRWRARAEHLAPQPPENRPRRSGFRHFAHTLRIAGWLRSRGG